MDISAFSSSIMQSMIEARNPMAKLVIKSFEDESKERELSLDRDRVDFVEELQRKLKHAKENGGDDAVVQGYVRLIDKYTGKAA